MEQQTLTISEDLYYRLQSGAQSRGLSVEQLVEQAVEEWERNDVELQQRRQLVAEIRSLQAQIAAEHGQMPDSVELLREDRER